MKNLGHNVAAVHVPDFYRPSRLNLAVNRLLKPVAPTPDYWGAGRLNLEIEVQAGKIRPDLAIFFQPVYVFAQTLARLKEMSVTLFAHFAGDAFEPGAASRFFFDGLALYDCHFSSIKESLPLYLHNRAARAVHLPPAIRSVPAKERPNLSAELGILGPTDSALPRTLARDGINARVFSPGEGNAFSIVLGLRDLPMTTLLEIAAQGGFLLLERTEEAKEMFREGVEAEHFADYPELRKKLDYYLKNRPARDLIARKGRERSQRPDLGYEARAQSILSEFRQLSARKAG